MAELIIQLNLKKKHTVRPQASDHKYDTTVLPNFQTLWKICNFFCCSSRILGKFTKITGNGNILAVNLGFSGTGNSTLLAYQQFWLNGNVKNFNRINP